jgi:hypothetical protein
MIRTSVLGEGHETNLIAADNKLNKYSHHGEHPRGEVRSLFPETYFQCPGVQFPGLQFPAVQSPLVLAPPPG